MGEQAMTELRARDRVRQMVMTLSDNTMDEIEDHILGGLLDGVEAEAIAALEERIRLLEAGYRELYEAARKEPMKRVSITHALAKAIARSTDALLAEQPREEA